MTVHYPNGLFQIIFFKVGTSLGIMIIEGKHSEVGQGIFISDIQENSNAEVVRTELRNSLKRKAKKIFSICSRLV